MVTPSAGFVKESPLIQILEIYSNLYRYFLDI